jgi:hypothetical protein
MDSDKSGHHHMLSRDYIHNSIKTEVAIQVKQEVDMQIRDHLAVSLTQQAIDTKKRITEMRIALANSSAFVFGTTICYSNLWSQ